MIKHKKLGRVCMCDCHKDGTDIREFIPCCGWYRQKYINEDGTFDEERLLALYEKYKIPLWTWWDRAKDRIGDSLIGTLHGKWRSWRRWQRLKNFKITMVKKPYPSLLVKDIVSVQPMTASVPDGIFKYEKIKG